MKKITKNKNPTYNNIWDYVSIPMSGEATLNLFKILKVKLIGRIRGNSEKVELTLNRKEFLDWVDKIKSKKK